MCPSAISVTNLNFVYVRDRPIFTGLDWEVEAGASWAVTGPSGCGKTTLLYLLAGLLTPQAGEVRHGSKIVTGPSHRVGLVLQEYGLLPWATVRANIEIGLKLRGKRPGREVDEWLDRVGIAEVASAYPGRISGGQKQRAALARTLVTHPELLLMDEAFASLDGPRKRDLMGLLRDLRRDEGFTLIFVAHDPEEVAALADHTLALADRPNDRGTVSMRDAEAFVSGKARAEAAAARVEGEAS